MKDKKMINPESVSKVRTNTSLQAPPMFKVIYIDDNTTSMQFVIDSLSEHFSYAVTTASKIANQVHENGYAVAAILPFELAEQKGFEITVAARKEGYPLQIKIEKETN